MIKAEWTSADTLDLQPTCNQLATDSISRQATIGVNDVRKIVEKYLDADDCNGSDVAMDILSDINGLPSAQSEPCELCSSLEKGDKLYQLSGWDGGIGFDYIWDIQYCPKCGRRLE